MRLFPGLPQQEEHGGYEEAGLIFFSATLKGRFPKGTGAIRAIGNRNLTAILSYLVVSGQGSRPSSMQEVLWILSAVMHVAKQQD